MPANVRVRVAGALIAAATVAVGFGFFMRAGDQDATSGARTSGLESGVHGDAGPAMALLDGGSPSRSGHAGSRPAPRPYGGEGVEEVEQAIVDDGTFDSGPVREVFDDAELARRHEAKKAAEAAGSDAYFAFLNDPKGSKSDAEKPDPVQKALWWLRAHQSPDGRFAAAGWSGFCDRKLTTETRPDPGMGDATYDVGTTGLALCAMLCAGYTNRGNHPLRMAVSRGLRFLKKSQSPTGRFGPDDGRGSHYNHVLATLAMLKAYELTSSTIYKTAVTRGVNHLLDLRTRGGAWGYGRRPERNDTSITAWAVLALHIASRIDGDLVGADKPAVFSVPTALFSEVQVWLDGLTHPDTGVVGYETRGGQSHRPEDRERVFPAHRTAAMTAAGTAMRYCLASHVDGPEDPALAKGLAHLLDYLPNASGRGGGIDYIHFFFGSAATSAAWGEADERWVWAGHLYNHVQSEQHGDETGFCQLRGSWDPTGVWGAEGGRVATTALAALTLGYMYGYRAAFWLR